MKPNLAQRIADAREKSGRAVKDAREIAEKIHAAEEKNEATGELETQFDKANADATASVRTLNRLLAEESLEEEHDKLTKPAERLGYRSPSEISKVVKATEFTSRQQRRYAERQMRARMELFARAGVSDAKRFEEFREAHSDATSAFILEGPVAAMKAFEACGFKPQEAMALVTTSGDLGGFLTADDMQAEVLRDLPTFAAMRPVCRVIPCGGPAITFPTIASATGSAQDKYSSGYTGAWKAEGYVTGGTAPSVQNQPTFGMARVPVHAWAPDAVELTSELLSDSKAPIESIVAEVIAESLGLDEDSGFTTGSGVNQPLGIMNTATPTAVPEVNSGAAATLTFEGLIDLYTGLPSQYRRNAKFMMNSGTFGAVLKLKDGEGHPLFPVNAIPGQLWAKDVVFNEFVAAVAANAYPIVFGDFRYYGIADRQELRIQRLTERFAPNIGILPTARLGGQVLRVRAFRKQKIAA